MAKISCVRGNSEDSWHMSYKTGRRKPHKPTKEISNKPRTIKNQQWMFTRLQIVSPFSEKSANEIRDARLALRVLWISRNACISPPHTHAAGEWQCLWICRLIKGLQNPTSESIGFARLKKSHKDETAVHGWLLPAIFDLFKASDTSLKVPGSTAGPRCLKLGYCYAVDKPTSPYRVIQWIALSCIWTTGASWLRIPKRSR